MRTQAARLPAPGCLLQAGASSLCEGPGTPTCPTSGSGLFTGGPCRGGPPRVLLLVTFVPENSSNKNPDTKTAEGEGGGSHHRGPGSRGARQVHPWARARAEGTRRPCPGVAFGLEQWHGSGCRTRRGAGNRAVSGGPARGEGAPAGVLSAYGRASASCTRSVPGCGLALSSPPSRERVGGRKLEGSPAVGSVGHLLLPPPPSSTLWAVCTAASPSATLRTHGHADRPCGE